jgi:superfamily II DNA or RNA helicase
MEVEEKIKRWNAYDGKFRSFKDSRDFARGLSVSGNKEWYSLYKLGKLPKDIPSRPDSAYKKDWISWKDFLGNDKVSFDECRDFARSLNLTKQDEWVEYTKLDSFPKKFPKSPNTFYNGQWVSWKDFLIGNKLENRYKTFTESKKFVRNLKIKSVDEWKKYSLSEKIPSDIPKNPDSYYKEEWISWTNFLKRDDFLNFNDAREFARGLGLKNQNEWYEYTSSNSMPSNIPIRPDSAYREEWKGFGDWLGNGNIATRGRNYRSFDNARNYIRSFKFKNQFEWNNYTKSKDFPKDVPKNPHSVYEEWEGMGDWLGNNNINPQEVSKKYWNFNDAREFSRKLGFKGSKEWFDYCDSGNKPDFLPTKPFRFYEKEWLTWSDWLGYLGDGNHRWTKHNLLAFIESLDTILVDLDSVELVTIINSNNLARKLKDFGKLETLVSSPARSDKRKEIINEIVEVIKDSNPESYEETKDDQPTFVEDLIEAKDLTDIYTKKEDDLKPVDPIQELKVYDNEMITASLDDENVDFLLKNQLKKLWNRVLNDEVDLVALKEAELGKNSQIVRDWFFTEYAEVNQIEIPEDYNFRDSKGNIIQPNLMQRLVTYRLIREKSYGNWSGVGAGKTLSAVLAGRCSCSKNVLIICNNATVEGWVLSINSYFRNNNIYIKNHYESLPEGSYTVINDKYDINLPPDENNYVVLNYETFQQNDGEHIAYNLSNNNTFDYIILDEVQNVKQRVITTESTRRSVVTKLITAFREKNQDLLMLAMSATPIINNLYEPKALIELLTGKIHNDLNTSENISNGIEMYKALTRYGLRYTPKKSRVLNENIVKINGDSLRDKVLDLPKCAVLDFETIFIDLKLNGIAQYIKPGTLIYTHYVAGITDKIGEFVKSMGLTPGYYIGGDKAGLDLFKRGKIDVLIGSAPVGTGVDGIQKVCNRIIKICLPWTSAEDKQLDGRVDRQGSVFSNVDIIIPQVVISLEDNNEWSWDKRRYNIVKFKSTLSDLALDGIIPKDLLPSKEKLMEDARKELKEWVTRIENDDILTTQREELKVPLSPGYSESIKRRLGDFSEMNKQWSICNSKTTHERLAQFPEEWYQYHTLYKEKRQTWLEIPYIEIAKKLSYRPDWIVGDFGCGENLLSKEIKNKVYAFDHIAIDKDVIACDMSNVPLDDMSIDVAVFSLSLMGSNYKEYIEEAYRTLRNFGKIVICEPAAKWQGRENDLKEIIESIGFKCFDAIKNTDSFLYLEGIKDPK